MSESPHSSKVVLSPLCAWIQAEPTDASPPRMVVGPKTINRNLSTNSMPTRATRIPTQDAWTSRRDNSRTTHCRITFIRFIPAQFRQKQSLKYCAYILMKVHTLDIDSSERDTNVYSYANNYTVTLKEPIYDVTQVKLIS